MDRSPLRADVAHTHPPLQERPAPAWDSARHGLRVEIYGAGGALGREIACALLAAGHAPSRLALYARSNRILRWRRQELRVEALPISPPQAEVAFLCTPPDVARALAPHLAQRGTRSVDLSGAYRGEPQVPLVLDGVNGEELGAFTEVVAMPLRPSALVARTLSVLEREVGLAEVDVFAVLSAASHGARGIFALRAELEERGQDGPARGGADVRVGNLRPARLPHVPDVGDAIAADTRRLLSRPDLLLDVSAVEGDLERCDAFAVKAVLYSSLEPLDAVELFAAVGGIQVEEQEVGPVPAAVAGSPRVHVGRIRAGSRGPRSLCFFAVGDQLRSTAAAALRVAARLPLPV